MKLIDNTKIDLTNLEDKISEAIKWSYNSSQRTVITLDNKSAIFASIDDSFHSEKDIFGIILDYSQHDDIEIDIHNEYENEFDEEYVKLYEGYKFGYVRHDRLLDYLENKIGTRYTQDLHLYVTKEKENFISELEAFLSQEETDLKNRIYEEYEEIKEEDEYILKSDEDVIFETAKEDLDYEELQDYEEIRKYIINNHATEKEDEEEY